MRAGYGKQAVLDGVAFDLAAGERLGVVGSSGAGKSTLLLALLGLLPWRRGWATGEVLLHGKNLLTLKEREARRMRGREIALVPQSPMTALNSALSLRGHFEEAWRAHTNASREELRARVKELMARVQLPEDEGFMARKPVEISVGQAQRVALALALLHRPAVLIADEPTSALDPATQVEILELLREVNRVDGTALLYISHDLLSVLQLCESVALLHQGCIAECLPVNGIEASAEHPAMRTLLRTLPAPADVLLRYAGRGHHKDLSDVPPQGVLPAAMP
jgi:ABC-type glutathione transport system ATPase component